MKDIEQATGTTEIIKTDKATLVRTGTFTLQPANLGEAMEFAKLIAMSELCPSEYRGKPQSVLIAVMMGAELGITPMQALQNIAVINGRPTMWGDLVLALVQASGLLEAIEERDAQEALAKGEGRCEVKRNGTQGSTVRTFSMAMAEKAGLTKRGGPSAPWSTYPGRMLQFRARSWALRDAFADVLKGLQVREEVDDYPPPTPPIQMPRRASEVSAAEVNRFVGAGAAAQPAQAVTTQPAESKPANVWIGKILNVKQNDGETKGKKWTLYTLQTHDAQEFGTFDHGQAEFSRGAGSAKVRIVWEKTERGSMKVIDIGPAEEDKTPVAEGPDA